MTTPARRPKRDRPPHHLDPEIPPDLDLEIPPGHSLGRSVDWGIGKGAKAGETLPLYEHNMIADNPESAIVYEQSMVTDNPDSDAVYDNSVNEAGGPIYDVPAVAIDPTEATVPAAGGTGSIAVTITAPGISGTWIVDKDSTATWLDYSPMVPQSTDGNVDWVASNNATGSIRIAHFYINGKTFTLTQDAAI
jgi:hypothetical protein